MCPVKRSPLLFVLAVVLALSVCFNPAFAGGNYGVQPVQQIIGHAPARAVVDPCTVVAPAAAVVHYAAPVRQQVVVQQQVVECPTPAPVADVAPAPAYDPCPAPAAAPLAAPVYAPVYAPVEVVRQVVRTVVPSYVYHAPVVQRNVVLRDVVHVQRAPAVRQLAVVEEPRRGLIQRLGNLVGVNRRDRVAIAPIRQSVARQAVDGGGSININAAPGSKVKIK
jgi:hypothetical protein